MSTKRFRIAFSFAGEKRAFVEQVAELLAQRFGQDKILYDKYHEAEFAVFNLGIKLPKLYGEESELIVPVLCPDYDAKRWTGWEWVHIYSLLTKADGHRVMPARFDYANADGLSAAAGFIELEAKTPAEFASLILQRLALNEGLPKEHYTQTAATAPKPRTSIPHNLPALQAFFGREDELRRMAGALDPEARTWGALIDGPGGMGKTSLAVRAAYAAPPQHFKRIVFATLKARELDDDGLRDLSGFLISGLQELLGELARELGADSVGKAAPEQRPRLLLEALRDTQSLLVLDNLESLTKPERDTVFNMVKRLPPGCKAILTSRGRIGSGAEEIILEKLGEQAALDTLAELAQRNPLLAKTSEAERLTLYRETGGKPLLLRWTAGQIGRGHCRSFNDALDFLRSCPAGNDPLEFIFGDLVEDFSPHETQALCALSYFSLPALLEHVAANAGLAAQDCDVALRGLANRSLVLPNEELTRFALVPMVAAYLRKKKPEVMAETRQRLEQRAFALIVENGYKNFARFPTLEAAWPGIAPALALFLTGDNQRLRTVCAALGNFLNFQGHWDEAIAVYEKAEGRAEAVNDRAVAGNFARNVGYFHALRQNAEGVLACAERASAHWVKARAGDHEQAEAALLRGIGLELKKDLPAAKASLEEALALYRRDATRSNTVGTTLNNLARIEQASGNYDAAEMHLREALDLALANDYEDGVATYVGNLADLALSRKDWPSAERLARDALALAQAVNRQELVGAHHCYIAKALLRGGNAAAEALPHAQRAVEIFTRLKSPDLAEAQAILDECGA